MKNRVLTLFTVIFCFAGTALSQNVGINDTGATPDASAALDVRSTKRGILVPRMTKAQRDAITSPATSLLIYQTDNTPGFYYYTGSAWTGIGGTDNDWTVGSGNVYTTDMVGIGAVPNSSYNLTVDGGFGALINSYLTVDGYTEIDRLEARTSASGMACDTLARFVFNGANSCGIGVYIQNDNAAPALKVVANPLISGDTAIVAHGVTGLLAKGVQKGVIATADTALHATGTTALYAKGNVRLAPASASADYLVSNIGIEPSLLPSANNYGYIGSNANRIYQGHFSNLTVYGTFTNLSDRSIKENIRPLSSPLEKILQLSGKQYDLKSDFIGITSETTEKKRAELEKSRANKIGFIAQELETVFPELVKYDEESGLKSVDYIGVIPVLVEAVKEQQTTINRLEEEVAKNKTLEERIARLEQLLNSENQK